jgi:hypothetical protein
VTYTKEHISRQDYTVSAYRRRVKLPCVLMAVFALLGAWAPAFAHHGFMGKPISARVCPTKAGGTPYRGSAGFIMLPDGIVRPVGQLKGGEADPKNF